MIQNRRLHRDVHIIWSPPVFVSQRTKQDGEHLLLSRFTEHEAGEKRPEVEGLNYSHDEFQNFS
jgi:hypothetical protein